MWCKQFYLICFLPLLSSWAEGIEIQRRYNPDRLISGIPRPRTCPRSCNEAGKDLQEWTAYHDLSSIAVCPEPMLLAYNLRMPLDDPNTLISIRACTLGDATTQDNYLADYGYISPDAKGEINIGPDGPLVRRQQNETGMLEDAIMCGTDSPRKSRVASKIVSWDEDSAGMKSLAAGINDGAVSDVVHAIKKLAEHVQKDDSCDKTIASIYVRGTLVSIYSGALIDKRKTSAAHFKRLSSEMEDASSFSRTAIEICGSKRAPSSTFGVVADASGDFAAVQKALLAWSEGECVSEDTKTSAQMDWESDVWSFDMSIPEGQSAPSRRLFRRQTRECRTLRVEQREECPQLAIRCGLGGSAFENFNKNTPNFCSTLQPGQLVCCSSGSLPNIKPQPDSNGACAVHSVEQDEGCQSIAVRYGLKQSDLMDFNKKTWGWDGCGQLLLGQKICVSKGDPPMPATYEDSQCGPTMPGSTRPDDGTELIDMNPCPLKVCCNVWGNCGTTNEFCTISNTTTGNPGTSKPGENGCQSNCGREVVNNDKGPDTFRKVAYFEAWNFNRACLHMNVLDIDDSYTHVHFAFGELSPDFQVVIPNNQKTQWRHFVGAKNFKPKKILAFGGWAFSNEGPNANLLRESVQPGNRDVFSTRVVQFAEDNGLDGLDFDWEYPGATDIDDSPPGNEDDGKNYYEFLKLVRRKLPKSKSLSIATPASYWYLREFPIEEMIKELDYIVYMTYDFHGQWDVDNKWAQPGCPAGNCLRSHINGTTTWDSLVMITKAGAPSHKVVVGVSSYGRSFKMADGGCRGEMCTYLGGRNDSPAKKGRCTDTGGYISNFEIEEIIDKGGAIKTWHDGPTNSDFLQYAGVEWVAYMSEKTKRARSMVYEVWNFGGTSDWAVDLQAEGERGEHDVEDSDYDPPSDWDRRLEPCPDDPDSMDEISDLDSQDKVPQHCAHKYLQTVMNKMYNEIQDRFDEILDDKYDHYYKYFARWTAKNAYLNLNKLMLSKGDEYYNCEIWSNFGCCGGNCEKLHKRCDLCAQECKRPDHMDGYDAKERRLRKMPCPPDYSERGEDNDEWRLDTIFWEYKNETAEENFLAEIFYEVGASPDFVEHVYDQRVRDHEGAMCEGGGVPPPGGPPGFDESSEYCQKQNWWIDAPRISRDFSEDDVYNPKDTIQKTLDDIDIDEVFCEFELKLLADDFGGNATELIDGLILPIGVMYDGLEHMEAVLKLGEEIKEAQTEAFIIDIISAVFLLVGGFGGVAAGAASAGWRFLGRTLVGLAEAGNTGLGFYLTVATPESAPLMIFNLMMSAVNIRDASKVSQAARLKTQLGARDIEGMSAMAAKINKQAAAVNNPPARPPVCRMG